MDISQLLKYTALKNASDLHLSSGEKPMIRVDGVLDTIPDTQVLDEDTIHRILTKLLPRFSQKRLEEDFDMDLSLEIPGISRFRVNVFRQFRGLSAAFRAIPKKIPTLEDLGIDKNIFYDLCNLPSGLVLITGPTGSGKTTTLAAMIDYVNEHKFGHIITIEDPIEYVHQSKHCLVQQREVYQHAKSFDSALSAALREDPDYILVGEMRDLETIRLALTAAETGHLVFATLHTGSAPKTIDRIVDVFPGDEKSMVRSMLSESLQAVISQALVPSIRGGRIVAQEIMLCTSAIRNMIREDKVPQIYSAIQTGQSKGMQTLEQNLNSLIRQGKIDPSVKDSLVSRLIS